ncbi:CotH kinase family protein, partial [candidate division KSB1 bacterium]|nr:CotH kinase family protein [candidate division KSB1 bacterium]
MKQLFFIAAIIVLCSSIEPIQAQAVDHWESVILANDLWKYRVGTSEPPSNWRALDFDDATWSEGRGGFGYGDDDDVTNIPEGTTSFYLRIRFDIVDLTEIGAAMFHIDYDDAFIAFINDKEVARSAGLSDEHPRYNTLSLAQHDAVMFEGGMPESYSLQMNVFQQGANILAIQVHNASVSSTDMSAIPFLSLGMTTSERSYRPTPNWFQAPFVFQSSNLPIVSINTNSREIPNEPKITAQMGIIQHEAGRNSLQDDFNHYNGFIGIERRGNASQSYDVVRGKWSYTIETRNADGSNNNVELLGMPKDNDWILTADFIDKTLMRNALAYHMSRSIGRWAPRTRHVELVLNGNYEGIYLLVEKIKPDNNRVNIARMDSSDISGENVTGGYVWDIQQADGTDIDFGERRVLKYPKADQVQPEQLAYIRNYDDEFRSVMQRSYYADPTRGYQKYIDVSSFIDEIIVQEATKNSDAYGWSG